MVGTDMAVNKVFKYILNWCILRAVLKEEKESECLTLRHGSKQIGQNEKDLLPNVFVYTITGNLL